MVLGYWQSATVLVHLYFGSSLAFIGSSCEHNQFCVRRSEPSDGRYSDRIKDSDRNYRLSQRCDAHRLEFEIRLGDLTSSDRSERSYLSDRFNIGKVWREDQLSSDWKNREALIRTDRENLVDSRDIRSRANRFENSRKILNSRRIQESRNDRLERTTRTESIRAIDRIRSTSNKDLHVQTNKLSRAIIEDGRSVRVNSELRSFGEFQKQAAQESNNRRRIERNNHRETRNQLVRNRLERTDARANLHSQHIIRATERIIPRGLSSSEGIGEVERREASTQKAIRNHQAEQQGRRIDSLQRKQSTTVRRESSGDREDREDNERILGKRSISSENRSESRQLRTKRQVRNLNSEYRREWAEERREALRISNSIDSKRRQRNERSRQDRGEPQESREESLRNKYKLVRVAQRTIKRNLERQIRSVEPRNRREQSRENSRLSRLAIHQERRIKSSERSERRIRYSEIRRETSEELQDRRESDIDIRRSVPEDRRQRVEQAQRRREVLEGPRRNIHDVVSNRREQVQTDRETFVDRRERTEMQRREENRSLERFSIRNNLVRSNRNEVDGRTKRIGALNNVVEELRLSLDRDMVRRNERSMHRLDFKIERFNIRSNINVDESQRVDRNHNDNQFYRSSERAHIDSRQNDRVERSGINRIEGNRRRLEQYRDQTRSLDLNKKSNGREDLRSAYNDHRMESTRTDREQRKYTERNISKRTEFSPVRTQQNCNIGEEFGRNFSLNIRSSVDTSIDSSRLVRDISSIKRLGPLSFRSIDNGESYVKKTADSTLMYQLIQAILMASIILSTFKRQDFPAKQKSKNWFLQKFSAIVNIY